MHVGFGATKWNILEYSCRLAVMDNRPESAFKVVLLVQVLCFSLVSYFKTKVFECLFQRGCPRFVPTNAEVFDFTSKLSSLSKVRDPSAKLPNSGSQKVL